MSLNTYQDLVDAIIKWPDLQGEVDLESVAPTLISLAEAQINNTLKLTGMVTTLPITSATEISEYALPDDYLELDRVVGPSGESLEARPADELVTWGTTPDEPCFYAVDARRVLFVPPVESATIRYFQRLPSLESVGTHWLYQQAPDLYLFGSLVQAAIFDKEAEQETSRYAAAYGAAMERVIRTDIESLYPRSQPLRAVPISGRKTRSTT